jgi:hypothetical protein
MGITGVGHLCPSFYRRPQQQLGGIDVSFLQDIMPFVLSNETVFYSFNAVGLLLQESIKCGGVPPMSDEMRRLMSKAYKALRKSVSEGGSSLDVTVWGMHAIISIYVSALPQLPIHSSLTRLEGPLRRA